MADYRVTFYNRLPNCNGRMFVVPQRTIQVEAARSEEEAIVAAQRAFCRQESVQCWQDHAHGFTIERRPEPGIGATGDGRKTIDHSQRDTSPTLEAAQALKGRSTRMTCRSLPRLFAGSHASKRELLRRTTPLTYPIERLKNASSLGMDTSPCRAGRRWRTMLSACVPSATMTTPRRKVSSFSSKELEATLDVDQGAHA
jgi:hypothetical protein